MPRSQHNHQRIYNSFNGEIAQTLWCMATGILFYTFFYHKRFSSTYEWQNEFVKNYVNLAFSYHAKIQQISLTALQTICLAKHMTRPNPPLQLLCLRMAAANYCLPWIILRLWISMPLWGKELNFFENKNSNLKLSCFTYFEGHTWRAIIIACLDLWSLCGSPHLMRSVILIKWVAYLYKTLLT